MKHRSPLLAVLAALLAVVAILALTSPAEAKGKSKPPQPTPSPTSTYTPPPAVPLVASVAGTCYFPYPVGVVNIWVENNTDAPVEFTTLHYDTVYTVVNVPAKTHQYLPFLTVYNNPWEVTVLAEATVLAHDSGQESCDITEQG